MSAKQPLRIGISHGAYPPHNCDDLGVDQCRLKDRTSSSSISITWGMGELGCYGGGILRGADTKRADKFATEGIKLTHYVVEPQCTPTRSALMTGRLPIRSGNH